jgi:S-DNA-T family DNA segregation ATPase FtsK/SpoIIIE
LTQFSLKLKSDHHLSRIKQLETDLAVSLSGDLVQIEDPTPEQPSMRLVLQNHRVSTVRLRQVLESETFQRFKGRVKVGLGLDSLGRTIVIDLAEMPHLLVGGTTGSGKSIFLNALVAELVCTYGPDELKLILIDPLAVELKQYNPLPHLVGPVITRSARALQVLNWVVQEIERRYQQLVRLQARDIVTYNQKAARAGQAQLPYLIIVIDNQLDLMLRAPKDLEYVLTRIAQKARGAGIHMVMSTVRTQSDTVAGSIKANFPGRIAFKTVTRADSQLILDASGAEGLLGGGDMLYKAPGTNRLERIQSVFVSEDEIKRIVRICYRG